jgi:hypothetical protein
MIPLDKSHGPLAGDSASIKMPGFKVVNCKFVSVARLGSFSQIAGFDIDLNPAWVMSQPLSVLIEIPPPIPSFTSQT